MRFCEIYNNVKSVLPDDIKIQVEDEFEHMAQKNYDSATCVCALMRFINERIGKSASNPLSVKVYSKLSGYSEAIIREMFLNQGHV